MTAHISLSVALLLATASFATAQETAQAPTSSAPVLAAPTVDSTGSGLVTPLIAPTDLNAAPPSLSTPAEGTTPEGSAQMAAPATPTSEATASSAPATAVPVPPLPSRQKLPIPPPRLPNWVMRPHQVSLLNCPP